MKRIVECVPNFSEGRRSEVVSAIAEAVSGRGVVLLDQEMDADHNRSVLTFVGSPEAVVEAALRAVEKGGTVVCAGIHMSEIPAFPYEILWGERVVRSVANLTRADGAAFLRIAPQAGVRTETQRYPLARANDALADLRGGRVHGAAVLVP